MLSFECRKSEGEGARDVVLLDMGQYSRMPPDLELPPVLGPGYFPDLASSEEVNIAGIAGGEAGGGGRGVADGGDAVPTVALQVSGGTKAAAASHLRLFQVLNPDLVARGRHFGTRVALGNQWKRLDMPYFDAPGDHHTCFN